MAIELSLAYFMPLFAFLLVFVVVYALLSKTKILGENGFIHSFVSLLAAVFFVVAPAARAYTMAVTPWLVVFLVCVFLMLFIISFIRGGIDDVIKDPRVGATSIVVLLLIFLISGIVVFGSTLRKYMPWSNETATAATATTGAKAAAVFFHPAVFGAFILFLIAAMVAWAMNRFK